MKPVENISVIMPVTVDDQEQLDATLAAVRSIYFSRADACVWTWILHLRQMSKNDFISNDLLSEFAEAEVSKTIKENGIVSSKIFSDSADHQETIPEAWNQCLRMSFKMGVKTCVITSNRVHVQKKTLRSLSRSSGAYDVISAYEKQTKIIPNAYGDGFDFECFVITPETIAKFGYFDENFHSAEYAGYDYFARVCLGGGRSKTLSTAVFEREFPIPDAKKSDKRYFQQKWGCNPLESELEILEQYWKRPYQNVRCDVTYWEYKY